METNMFTDPFYPTYNEIHGGLKKMADVIRASNNVTEIVAIARGGTFPGLILSHMLGVPMHVVHFSSKNGNGDNRNHTNDVMVYTPTNEILIVDDIADSGKTFRELVGIYSARYEDAGVSPTRIVTACVHYKESSEFLPDYSLHTLPADSPFVYYPYECE
jgi:hypoxanthine phosphoribosyltransferase